MSLCSELENIKTSINYFRFIKDVFCDYNQYIINYNLITNEYLQKLKILQEKFKDKLTGNESNDIKYKNIKTSHLFSLTSSISKIIDKQIENLDIFNNGINCQIEVNNNFLKEKEILSNKFELIFEESRKDLIEKYKEIDKLKEIYKINMENTEDTLYKYFNNKFNDTITKDQVNNMLITTKKIENEYKSLINSTKFFEETFDSLYLSSLENFKKLSSETSNQMKESIMDFIVLFKNNLKLQLSEIDLYIPKLSKLDEIKTIENIINNSYKANNKLIHIKPEKYKLKAFQKHKEKEDNLNVNQILNFDDGFEEMILINDENLIKILKIMKDNFEFFEDNQLNIKLEEEKLKCLKLTQKIFNIENPKLQKQIPTEEELEYLNVLLDKHHNRIIFLHKLTEFRNTKFEISQKCFDILCKLFNTLVNAVQRDKDYYSIKNIIILSQTFFINGKNENEKIYLQKKIQNNEIFKSQEFWSDFIDYSINEDIYITVNNDVKNGNILKENRKDSEDKKSNIFYTKIISFAYNMISFEIDKEIIKQVVLPKTEKYKISDELLESIKGIINNC